MKVRNKRLFAILAALVAISMVATGCGGGGAKVDDGAAKEAVKVKIGVSAPFTGDIAALGLGIKNGATLAIEAANADPEAEELGIEFEGLFVDDAGDPKTGVNAAAQMISDAKIIGIVGHLNSGISIPTSEKYREAGLVMISPASTNPKLTQQGFENVFRVCATDDLQGSFAADFAVDKLGAKSVAIVSDSTPYGDGLDRKSVV